MLDNEFRAFEEFAAKGATKSRLVQLDYMLGFNNTTNEQIGYHSTFVLSVYLSSEANSKGCP